ncbi:dienelactone hydrolase [Nocardiopsis arvandica]|uniref:Poly(ethylene terephthalate) hydrolase n=1 Tax=Nocardiopsis sinuspersici TaxID=501010 RepID=A0A7Y9XCA4_9ACTN|nr:dienelactone hydrolase [Nocardiopsis sinuspersici]
MRNYPLAPETDGARRSPRSRVSRIAARAALTLTLVAGVTGGVVAPAQAASPYERGPAPTESSVTATRGYFDTDTESVSSWVSGFGGGTIFYPSDSNQTFGGVVIAPGYTASSSTMEWMGHRIASQGFVVFTIDTNTRYDQPDSRGRQLEAALDYLADDSDVSDLVDGDRMAVMGHSMGGGGTLAAAEDRPELRAAIPLTPWHTQKNWDDVQVPTMIIGAENDSVASVRSHSIPFYESLDDNLESAYVELEGASHFAPNMSNTAIAKYSISWLKRFVDEDERYEQFLCPPPSTGLFSDFSDYRDTCPHLT